QVHPAGPIGNFTISYDKVPGHTEKENGDGSIGSVATCLLPAACNPSATDRRTRPSSRSWIAPDLCRIFLRHLTAIVEAALPIYNEESARLRDMVYERSTDDR